MALRMEVERTAAWPLGALCAVPPAVGDGCSHPEAVAG